MKRQIDYSTIYEVTTNLIGDIRPVGSEHIDTVRNDNLKTHISIMNMLIDDVIHLIGKKEDYRSSVKTSGEIAYKELKGLSEILPEILGETDNEDDNS